MTFSPTPRTKNSMTSMAKTGKRLSRAEAHPRRDMRVSPVREEREQDRLVVDLISAVLVSGRGRKASTFSKKCLVAAVVAQAADVDQHAEKMSKPNWNYRSRKRIEVFVAHSRCRWPKSVRPARVPAS